MGLTRKDVSPVLLGASKLAVMRGRHRQSLWCLARCSAPARCVLNNDRHADLLCATAGELSLIGCFMLTRTQDQCDAMQRSGKFPVPDWQRAGGDCVCEVCGQKYYDHPQHIPYYQLHVLCDGRYVKL